MNACALSVRQGAERFAVAVVRQALQWIRWQVCDRVKRDGIGVLPILSPGLSGWELSAQARLHEMIALAGELPGPLELLESSMLMPKTSQLGVFALSEGDKVRASGCKSCEHPACAYRRT